MREREAALPSSRQDEAASHGQLHRLVAVLLDCATALDIACECKDMEELALMVHRIMSWQSRQFHTLEHVFGFLEAADPYTALAAVFHDLVYYQVDDRLPPELSVYLDPFIKNEGGEIRLESAAQDRTYELCLEVFGLSKGELLKPLGGLNEFLSALAMAKALERHLGARDLAAIAVCIEASIPFRGLDPEGRGIGQVLEARLSAMIASGMIKAPADAAVEMTRRAIQFGNQDVRDFAFEDTGEFLSNTWKLIPESNAALRRSGAYSIREYRIGLEKMLLFFLNLDPATIYHAHRGEPDQKSLAELAESARRNIESGKFYLKAKLLATSLLEAIAESTGGQAPVALFMGDIPRSGEQVKTLLSYLPKAEIPSWLDTSNAVYKLLKDGRLDDSSFDLSDSPLALHLFLRLPVREWSARSADVERYCRGELDARTFLGGFDRDILVELIKACEIMVPTRQSSLAALAAALK